VTEHPGLARLFAVVWDAFIDGVGIDAWDLEKLIEDTGLAEWRPATEDDLADLGAELDIGDPVLVLTEEGRRIVDEGREAAQ
jgi:hypothetical protein